MTYGAEVVDFVVVVPDERQLMSIGDDLVVPGRFVIDRGDVRLDVDYTTGRPVVNLTLRDVGRQQLRRLRYATLLEQGTAHVVRTLVDRPVSAPPAPPDPELAALLERLNGRLATKYPDLVRRRWSAGERVRDPVITVPAVRRSVRARVTDEDVELAAAAYRESGIEGVKRAFTVGGRQAWRYVERAQAAGLLEKRRLARGAAGQGKKAPSGVH